MTRVLLITAIASPAHRHSDESRNPESLARSFVTNMILASFANVAISGVFSIGACAPALWIPSYPLSIVSKARACTDGALTLPMGLGIWHGMTGGRSAFRVTQYW